MCSANALDGSFSETQQDTVMQCPCFLCETSTANAWEALDSQCCLVHAKRLTCLAFNSLIDVQNKTVMTGYMFIPERAVLK